MGWTGGKLDGPANARNLLAFECGEDLATRTLDTAKIGSVVYAAVPTHNDPNVVFGLVLLTERRDGMVWTKPVPEDMGPAEDRCPERILALLTPTDSADALEWRARCRARNARPMPKAGQWVRFATPMQFTNGESHDSLAFVSGSRFRTPDGALVYMANWRGHEFTVTT